MYQVFFVILFFRCFAYQIATGQYPLILYRDHSPCLGTRAQLAGWYAFLLNGLPSPIISPEYLAVYSDN
jgi:hypothetical protein